MDPAGLPVGTAKELGVYRIELPSQSESKQIKVRVNLTVHGTFQVEGAQLVEEEEYVETTKEKRELPAEPKDAEAPVDAPKEEVKEEKVKEPEKDSEAKEPEKTETEKTETEKEPEKKEPEKKEPE